jgi:hypothetical protein
MHCSQRSDRQMRRQRGGAAFLSPSAAVVTLKANRLASTWLVGGAVVDPADTTVTEAMGTVQL